jgi:hypothetical protein
MVAASSVSTTSNVTGGSHTSTAPDRTAEGHWIHAVLGDLLDIPRGVVSPDWLIDAANRLPERDTPLDGARVEPAPERKGHRA